MKTENERNEIIRGLRKGGVSLSDIGREFGFSKERARQLTIGIVPNKPKKLTIASNKYDTNDDSKICGVCKEIKNKTEFHKDSGSKDGLSSKCKLCAGKLVTEYHRKRKHGLGREGYLELLDKQDGKCAICGRSSNEFIRELAVDHDHSTGKVRGLLCWGCNLILGNARDSIEILQSAINYLSKTLDKDENVLYTIESQVK